MADFMCTTLTEKPFKVKDPENFWHRLKWFGIELEKDHQSELFYQRHDDAYDIYGHADPGTLYGQDGEDEIEFEDLIQEHILPGEIAIIKTAGAEKCRYIGAWALIITSNKIEYVNLDDAVKAKLFELGLLERKDSA